VRHVIKNQKGGEMIKVLNILEHWALPVALFNLTVFIFAVEAIIKLLEVV